MLSIIHRLMKEDNYNQFNLQTITSRCYQVYSLLDNHCFHLFASSLDQYELQIEQMNKECNDSIIPFTKIKLVPWIYGSTFKQTPWVATITGTMIFFKHFYRISDTPMIICRFSCTIIWTEIQQHSHSHDFPLRDVIGLQQNYGENSSDKQISIITDVARKCNR